MRRSHSSAGPQQFIIIAVGIMLLALVLIALWAANPNAGGLTTTRSGGSEITLAIDRDQADDIAVAHTRGSVVDTDVIRDNGVISYLVTVNPELDNGDGDARRVLFIDPVAKSVTRVERWNVDVDRDVLMTEGQAEAAALTQAGVAAKVTDSDLQTYEGRDVWQIKVDVSNALSRLVTVDAETGEVLRNFELLEDY